MRMLKTLHNGWINIAYIAQLYIEENMIRARMVIEGPGRTFIIAEYETSEIAEAALQTLSFDMVDSTYMLVAAP